MSVTANRAAKARKARRDRGDVLFERRPSKQAEVLEHVTATSRVSFDRASLTLESSSFERLSPTKASAQKPTP